LIRQQPAKKDFLDLSAVHSSREVCNNLKYNLIGKKYIVSYIIKDYFSLDKNLDGVCEGAILPKLKDNFNKRGL
jgi:hypothetical protein